MSANKPAAERLAQAFTAADVPFDAETAAGMMAIGTALLRAHGLSLDEIQQLVAGFYVIAPTLTRAALEEP